MKKDVPRLADFLDQAPKGVRIAFEFRHESVVRRRGVGHAADPRRRRSCVAEGEIALSRRWWRRPICGATGALRRTKYSDAVLKEWADKILCAALERRPSCSFQARRGRRARRREAPHSPVGSYGLGSQVDAPAARSGARSGEDARPQPGRGRVAGRGLAAVDRVGPAVEGGVADLQHGAAAAALSGDALPPAAEPRRPQGPSEARERRDGPRQGAERRAQARPSGARTPTRERRRIGRRCGRRRQRERRCGLDAGAGADSGADAPRARAPTRSRARPQARRPRVRARGPRTLTAGARGPPAEAGGGGRRPDHRSRRRGLNELGRGRADAARGPRGRGA